MDDNKPQDNQQQDPVVTPPATGDAVPAVGDTPQPVVPPAQEPVADKPEEIKPEVEPEVKPAEGVTETPAQPPETQEPTAETSPSVVKPEGDTDTQAV